jgi:hypothetical protein
LLLPPFTKVAPLKWHYTLQNAGFEVPRIP